MRRHGINSFIMADWDTYKTVAPVEMVKACNEWLIVVSGKYMKFLSNAVKEGKLSRAVLEHKVLSQVRLLQKWM